MVGFCNGFTSDKQCTRNVCSFFNVMLIKRLLILVQCNDFYSAAFAFDEGDVDHPYVIQCVKFPGDFLEND